MLDPALVFKRTTRSATADLIKLEKVSKDRLSLVNPGRRREDLPGVSPTVAPGNFVWLEVTFAYRGQQTATSDGGSPVDGLSGTIHMELEECL